MSNIGSGELGVLLISILVAAKQKKLTPTVVVNECNSTITLGLIPTEKLPELKSLFNAPT